MKTYPEKKKMIKKSFHLSEDLDRMAWNIGRWYFFATTEAEAYRQLIAYAVRNHKLVPPLE